MVNDTYGHAAGDEILRLVSREMTSCLRDIDKVFRLGGEEFAVLLPGADAAAAKIAADRLRAAVAANCVKVEDYEISVTASIGIAASLPESGVAALIDRADSALYRAKADGRNRTVLSAT